MTTTNKVILDYTPKEYTPDGLPIIPRLPENPLHPTKPAPDGAVAVCGECGLRILPVMGYVCSNPRCPCGLGGATC